MSLFRRPLKKPIQRRVFSSHDGDEDNEHITSENSSDSTNKVDSTESSNYQQTITMNKTNSRKDDHKKKHKEDSHKSTTAASSSSAATTTTTTTTTKSSLLSFGDEEDEDGEIFQVKKSSHSKKVMKMLDKERRKKRSKEQKRSVTTSSSSSSQQSYHYSNNNYEFDNNNDSYRNQQNHHQQENNHFQMKNENNDKNKKRNKSDQKMTIQTEIRTDDFVLVVKKSDNTNLILNGRDALCAGRDDMSSEDEQQPAPPQASSSSSSKNMNKNAIDDDDNDVSSHRFSKPDNFKKLFEGGTIPDAATIHAARKSRQKAREKVNTVPNDYIPIDDKPKNKGRLVRDDVEDDASDDEERVDMSAITGAKEIEERRKKFYSVQQEYTGSDSDNEMNEWENQQIRKGVTGAQVVNAQQESAYYSQFMIKSMNESTATTLMTGMMSTANLLEQAYARNSIEKPKQLRMHKSDNKRMGPQTPAAILNRITERYNEVKDIHEKHLDEIDDITRDLRLITIEEIECEQNAPVVASKFRFYQDLRGYVIDLVDCLNEKVPVIAELEKKSIGLLAKHANYLIERRRQDVRDQAKEMTDIGKPSSSSSSAQSSGRKLADDEERVRRAAERQGRRTRRRRDRERININNTHLDGMSSDDEIGDHEANIYKSQLEQISEDAKNIFDDTNDEYHRIPFILEKFETWKKYDIDSYKDTYFSLCLPKIMGPMIRLHLVRWNPLEDNCKDFEKMEWYCDIMKYGWTPTETEESLLNDPDCKLIPIVIEKIILPKLTEIIETCWDPLSTSQTLKLVGLIGRLCRDYPTLRPTSDLLQKLFIAILDKMKSALDNDVFIPIFPKQIQESKSSFFQRQFCSGLKLFRNLLSFQGILSDSSLKEMAILSLLNRYLLSAMRVCTPVDVTSKAYIIVNTLPRVWLQPDSEILESLTFLDLYLQQIATQLDSNFIFHQESIEKLTILRNTLHSSKE